RFRQADVRLRGAVGVPFVLAVADHLVRQHALGDPLVPDASQWRMAILWHAIDLPALCVPVRSTAFAQPEARCAAPGGDRGDAPGHAHGGLVLADCAKLLLRLARARASELPPARSGDVPGLSSGAGRHLAVFL